MGGHDWAIAPDGLLLVCFGAAACGVLDAMARFSSKIRQVTALIIVTN